MIASRRSPCDRAGEVEHHDVLPLMEARIKKEGLES